MFFVWCRIDDFLPPQSTLWLVLVEMRLCQVSMDPNGLCVSPMITMDTVLVFQKVESFCLLRIRSLCSSSHSLPPSLLSHWWHSLLHTQAQTSAGRCVDAAGLTVGGFGVVLVVTDFCWVLLPLGYLAWIRQLVPNFVFSLQLLGLIVTRI